MKILIRVFEWIGDFLTCWLCCVQLADCCQSICFCSILLSNWIITFLRKPLDCAVLCCAVLFCVVLCCAVLCCTALFFVLTLCLCKWVGTLNSVEVLIRFSRNRFSFD